jgi:hypothetical protein
MIIKPAKIIGIQYSVEVDLAEFKQLDNDDWKKDVCLIDILDKIDYVHSVEHNAHFGNCIYFTVEFINGSQHNATLKTVSDLLAGYEVEI